MHRYFIRIVNKLRSLNQEFRIISTLLMMLNKMECPYDALVIGNHEVEHVSVWHVHVLQIVIFLASSAKHSGDNVSTIGPSELPCNSVVEWCTDCQSPNISARKLIKIGKDACYNNVELSSYAKTYSFRLLIACNTNLCKLDSSSRFLHCCTNKMVLIFRSLLFIRVVS